VKYVFESFVYSKLDPHLNTVHQIQMKFMCEPNML